jgi:predicted nucleic acid-binding protein
MLVLDINVISELRKVQTGKADPSVAQWTKSINNANLFLSAISIHELEKGILLAERKDPPQGAVFRVWLHGQVLPAFTGRILPVDAAVALRSAQQRPQSAPAP